MKKRHHIVLVAGLGSSICPGRYAKWARILKKEILKAKLPVRNLTIHIVSSDGQGENTAVNAVLTDHKADRLGKVVMAGHSNGARDMLFAIKALARHGIEIAYAAAIDMTLGEFGAKAGAGIVVLDEFWAALQRVDFDDNFNGKYTFFNLDKMSNSNVSHMGAAVHPITQGRILAMIEAEFTA